MKKYDRMFSISLAVIGFSNIIFAGSNIFEFELPGVIVILIGILNVVAAVMLIYSSVKKMN